MTKPINHSIVEDIIAKSGNVFHYKVVDFLRTKGWIVSVAPYYNDSITDKPREIDIIAEKEFDVKDRFGTSWLGTVNVKLYVECKYVTTETIFWFDKLDHLKAFEKIKNDLGIQYPEPDIHHYAMSPEKLVAKLFDSGNKQETDNHVVYKALNQSLNAMVSFRRSPSLIPKKRNKISKILRTLNYPIIVCNSFEKFYSIDTVAKLNPVSIEDNFQLEINYAYFDRDREKSISEYFLVDIVSIDRLEILLNTIEKIDLETAKNSVQRSNE